MWGRRTVLIRRQGATSNEACNGRWLSASETIATVPIAFASLPPAALRAFGAVCPCPPHLAIMSAASSSTDVGARSDSSLSPMGAKATRGFIRVPRPKKTGNEIVDDQNMALYNTKLELIQALCSDDRHVMPLWNKLLERQKKNDVLSRAGGDDVFPKEYTTLRKFIDDQAEWVVSWLAEVSKKNPELFVAAQTKDPEALERFVTVEVGLPGSWRIPPDCMRKRVMYGLMNKLSCKFGGRLKVCDEAVLGKDENGDVHWEQILWEMVWKDEALQSITHRPTGDTVDISKLGITNSYTLKEPWSDFSSGFLSLAGAPTKMTKLFKNHEGPNKHANPMKGKTVPDLLTEVFTEISEFKKQVTGAASHTLGEIGNTLAAHKAAQKRKQMANLREKAAEAVATKAAKRTFKLG